MSQRLFILAMLIGAAVGSAWLLQRLSGDATKRAAVDHHDPDYYMEDFTTLTMKENGNPKNKIHAVYMAHYPDNDTTELLKPQMEIFREDKLPLYIAAEKGWVTGDDEAVFLRGAVKVWELDEKGNSTVEINTTDVRVLLDDEYAETDQYATIVTNSSTITGTGMRAFFPERRLEIINHDKTTIDAAPDS